MVELSFFFQMTFQQERDANFTGDAWEDVDNKINDGLDPFSCCSFPSFGIVHADSLSWFTGTLK